MSEANVMRVLGISDADIAAEDRWQSRLSAAADVGFEAIELPADVAAERISQAAARGLRLAVLRGVGGDERPRLASADGSTREQALAEVQADLERAADAGASVLTVRPAESRLRPEVVRLGEYADALQATHQGLRALAEPAARCGVTIGIEVGVEGFLLSPVEARELIELVGSPLVGACVDLSIIGRSGQPADWIRTLRHRLVCLRMGADLVGVDLEATAAALGEVRYNGPVVVAGDPAAAVGCLGGS
jgi:L-ribulose-5-phosphate 3-epimerase